MKEDDEKQQRREGVGPKMTMEHVGVEVAKLENLGRQCLEFAFAALQWSGPGDSQSALFHLLCY